MTLTTLCRLLLLTCLIFGAPARADKLDDYIALQMRLRDAPAVVVGVIRDGKVVDARASGLVNVELGVKATEAHVFEIGSISKQFTAYAILMLKEQGKLQLDAPVGRYLPGLPAAWAQVSLHRLVTHTSGLPDLEEAFGYGVYRETPSDVDFLKRITALPLDAKPGERWHYSNTNYWLLARVIETLSGQRYADFMQQRIFTPLGMTSTRSALPATVYPMRAAGYEWVSTTLENRDAIQPNTGRGLGDIASTLGDMAKWDAEQLNPRLISAASAQLARQPVKLNDGSTAPYAYGWFTDRILPMQSFQHEGQTAGFCAGYIRVPGKRLAVVVFVNLYNTPAQSIGVAALGHADASLVPPRLQPITDLHADITERVSQMLAGAPSAETQWREDWFAPDYWRALRPALPDVARVARRLGEVKSLRLVKAEGEGAGLALTYRVVHAGLTRLVTLRFDGKQRIESKSVSDEW